MKTKIGSFKEGTKIPAGIFTGTELFAKEGEMYAMHEGKREKFDMLPAPEKDNFIALYLADKEGQKFILEYFGIQGFNEAFKQWLFCKFGSLDGNPDSINGEITPDKYNSACTKKDCPGRGKFCGIESGLRNHDIETLREIATGKTTKEIAEELHVAVSTVKSRVEKLKEKFSAANVAALAALAADLGI